MFSPHIPRLVWVVWLLFMVGAVPTNLLVAKIRSIVLAKGLEFSVWSTGLITGLRNYHRVIAGEQDPDTRASYQRLAFALYLCFAWCLVLLIAFGILGFRAVAAV